LVWSTRRPPVRVSARFSFVTPDNTSLVRASGTPLCPRRHAHRSVAERCIPNKRDLGASAGLAGTATNRWDGWRQQHILVAGRPVPRLFRTGQAEKDRARGGPPQNICSSPPGVGAAWSPAGEIVFNPTNRAPLMRVSAAEAHQSRSRSRPRAPGELAPLSQLPARRTPFPFHGTQ